MDSRIHSGILGKVTDYTLRLIDPVVTEGCPMNNVWPDTCPPYLTALTMIVSAQH